MMFNGFGRPQEALVLDVWRHRPVDTTSPLVEPGGRDGRPSPFNSMRGSQQTLSRGSQHSSSGASVFDYSKRNDASLYSPKITQDPLLAMGPRYDVNLDGYASITTLPSSQASIAEISSRRRFAIEAAFKRMDRQGLGDVSVQELWLGLQSQSHLSPRDQERVINAIVGRTNVSPATRVTFGQFARYYHFLSSAVQWDSDFEGLLRHHWGFAEVAHILDDMKNKFAALGVAYTFRNLLGGDSMVALSLESFQTALGSVGMSYSPTDLARVFDAFTGGKVAASTLEVNRLAAYLTSAPRLQMPLPYDSYTGSGDFKIEGLYPTQYSGSTTQPPSTAIAWGSGDSLVGASGVLAGSSQKLSNEPVLAPPETVNDHTGEIVAASPVLPEPLLAPAETSQPHADPDDMPLAPPEADGFMKHDPPLAPPENDEEEMPLAPAEEMATGSNRAIKRYNNHPVMAPPEPSHSGKTPSKPPNHSQHASSVYDGSSQNKPSAKPQYDPFASNPTSSGSPVRPSGSSAAWGGGGLSNESNTHQTYGGVDPVVAKPNGNFSAVKPSGSVDAWGGEGFSGSGAYKYGGGDPFASAQTSISAPVKPSGSSAGWGGGGFTGQSNMYGGCGPFAGPESNGTTPMKPSGFGPASSSYVYGDPFASAHTSSTSHVKPSGFGGSNQTGMSPPEKPFGSVEQQSGSGSNISGGPSANNTPSPWKPPVSNIASGSSPVVGVNTSGAFSGTSSQPTTSSPAFGVGSQLPTATPPPGPSGTAAVKPENTSSSVKRKRVVTIGINYSAISGATLSGCINDSEAIIDVLTKKFEFDIADIRQLRDDHPQRMPTKKNMMLAMQWLVKDAQEGDHLFFHYSGHGSQQEDENSDEMDGKDETLVPCDFQTNGMISDDVLRQTMIASLPAGVRLTCLLDCCHSGTALDLPYKALLAEDGRSLSLRKRDDYRCPNPSLAEICAISGCRDDQTSADIGAGAAGNSKAAGAMTTAFINVISKTPAASYHDLLIDMLAFLKSKQFEQVPQMTSENFLNFTECFMPEALAPKADLPVPQRPGNRKALCIGINYMKLPPGQGRLDGCCNDAETMVGILKDIFKFKPDEINCLRDDRPKAMPTYANMMKAFQELVQDAHPGDEFFLHYSGHGGTQRDVDGDELTGNDETLIPCDFQTSGQITDDVLYEVLVKPLPRGCRMWVILDCCHSGTALDLHYRVTVSNDMKNCVFDMAGKRGNNQHRSEAEIIMLSGCKDEQTSADISAGTLGTTKAAGALTTAFKHVLTPEISCQNLLVEIRKYLKRNRFDQIPQMSSEQFIQLDSPFVNYQEKNVSRHLSI